MNMFKPTTATTIQEYIDALEPTRRDQIIKLHEFIQQTVPSLRPHFASNMIGYGSFKYRNYKGEIIDWPTVAVASQKNYISIYVCSIVDGAYVAELNAKKLGAVQVGKSCIRFKQIENLHLKELADVLRIAEQHPGLR